MSWIGSMGAEGVPEETKFVGRGGHCMGGRVLLKIGSVSRSSSRLETSLVSSVIPDKVVSST